MKWFFGTVVAGLLVVLTIAGSEKLFRRAVPLAQRLVSHDEAIRTRAQQELLGLSSDDRRRYVAFLLPSLGAPDPFVRKWSAIAAALAGPAAQEALPALLSCSGDPEKDVAQACRVALAEIGIPDRAQLPILLRALEAPSVSSRCEAASAIAKMGPEAREAVPVFVSTLRLAPSWPDCMEEAQTRFAQAEKSFPDALLGLLQDASVETRRRAVSVLARLDPKPEEVVDALLKVLGGDEDGRVRRSAARAIGLRQAPERGLTPALIAASEKASDEAVRQIALSRLRQGDAEPSTLMRVIAGRLKDDSAAIRLSAVDWLSQRGSAGRAARPALLQVLKDPDPRVRRAALEAIRQLGFSGVKTAAAIARTQRDDAVDIRCAAGEWLAENGYPDRIAVSVLARDLAESTGDAWRCAADVLSLSAAGNHETIPALASLLAVSDKEVRRRAIHVAAHLGPRARPLRAALRKAAHDGIPGASLALQTLLR